MLIVKVEQVQQSYGTCREQGLASIEHCFFGGIFNVPYYLEILRVRCIQKSHVEYIVAQNYAVVARTSTFLARLEYLFIVLWTTKRAKKISLNPENDLVKINWKQVLGTLESLQTQKIPLFDQVF